MDYKEKNILVTGGLGFIGSSLAIELVRQGARVTLVDAMIPGYGGNLHNIESIKEDVIVNFADVRDEHVMNYLVRGKDYVFHLAGQVSHIMSLSDPFPDIDINIKGTAIILEACKKYNREAVIIRAGTRGQYGNAKLLPVSEEAPMNPKGIYEISQVTAESMMTAYHNIHELRCVMMRLTNIFGPRAQMHTSHYGVANWFIRLALERQPIKVFGTGLIKRDFIFIDDCVSALLLAGCNEKCQGEIYNIGSDKPSNFLELAKTICALAEGSSWEYAPFSPERAAQEPGDFYSDISKIRSHLGWEPRVTLLEGVRATMDFYRSNKEWYW